MMSAKSSALPARVQNSTALKRSVKTDATHPPSKPIKSFSAVNKGNIKVPATTRGVTSLRLGAVPIPRIASTCSVTTMDPNPDAMPDAHRPPPRIPLRLAPQSPPHPTPTPSPAPPARDHLPGRVCSPKILSDPASTRKLVKDKH